VTLLNTVLPALGEFSTLTPVNLLDAGHLNHLDALFYVSMNTASHRINTTTKTHLRGFSSSRSGRRMKRGPSTPPRATGYRARPYNIAIGLPDWQNRDPMWERGGINLYGYVRNNPIDLYDLLGLSPGTGLLDWGGANSNGGSRGIGDGPKYGNWGGQNWSGGTDGQQPPIDSSDSCYKAHDNCYSSCDSKSGCNGRKGHPSDKLACIRSCDNALHVCLSALSNDPKNWPIPPPPGLEGGAANFRTAALTFFPGN